MADSGSRSQRASALEEKKRKLEDLKKRRELRGGEQAAARSRVTTDPASLDEYVDSLIGGEATPPPQSVDKNKEEAPVVNEAANGDAKSVVSAASNVIAEPAPAPPVKMVETFTIGTQTEKEDIEELEGDPLDQVEASLETKPAIDPTDESAIKEQGAADQEPKVLTSEEVLKTVSSKPFASFINTASKKVERVLGAPILSELLVDYVGVEEGGGKRAETKDSNSKFLQSQQVYECKKWTADRDVTDIDWSPLHRELVLTTYHMPNRNGDQGKGETAVSAVCAHDTLSSSLTPRSGELQSDGLALIWSLAMPHRPEHIFTCGSPLTAGRFHPTDPTLIIGGCESGQLVVWDIRSGRLPVQKSSLSMVAGANAKGHTHPIIAMEVIEGGTGLVTASGDGRMNFWSLSNLREPAESILIGSSLSTFTVSPESESILAGDEQGTMYSVASQTQAGSGQRSGRRQAKKLTTVDDEGENHGHYGLITSLSAKTLKKGATTRAAGITKGFLRGSGGLTLSAGVDWTVKLWAPAYTDRPLVSFVSHSYDYMSDVTWNPAHPTLFATASSSGSLGLWNLAHSFDGPVTDSDGIPIETDNGLNKLKWSLDGRRLAAASSDRLHVVSLADDLIRAKGDEDNKVMNLLLSRGLIDRP